MTTETLESFDPLPRRYLTDGPGIGGRIKVRPEDFLVEEQPLYEPVGEGEHLYLFVEKRNISHFELISALQQHFQIDERAIGYAGMKDKLGVTRQLVSIHLPPGEHEKAFEHDQIHLLWTDRHRNKLKRGHLAGNRFSIRIRDVDPLDAPKVLDNLKTLERIGVPNHFGFQRFGYRRNNHRLGAALLREDWQGLINELLGSTGADFPEHQRKRRELFDAGQYREALELWSRADRSERHVLRALSHGIDEKRAVFSVGKNAWTFWISALQSAIFNRVLDVRLSRGLLGTLVEGDLAWKHNSRKVFPITVAELAVSHEPAAVSDEPTDDGQPSPAPLDERLRAFEISPSGPMWGAEMREAEGDVARIEREAAESLGIEIDLLRTSHYAPTGTRRPLRERLTNPEIDSGIDEHGPFIRVAFDLPPGVYATVVLREIMKDHGDAGDHI